MKDSTGKLSISIQNERLKLLLFTLPLIMFVVAFRYVPIFGWSYAFTDYFVGARLGQLNFVGFKHFLKIFSGGSEFLNVLKNTLVLSFLKLFRSPAPMIFAIMISQVKSRRFSRIVQTVSAFPHFVSWILMYSLVFMLFSSESGAIAMLLRSLSFPGKSVNILAKGDSAWIWMTVLSLIKDLGYEAIIYLAAIAGVDPELYDSASVDGAGRFTKIWHITIPHMIPTYMVLLLLSIASILNSGFEQYFVFQNAFTIDKLEVIDTYTYRQGITRLAYSYSTAVGVYKTLVSIILLTCANFGAKKIRGESLL